MSLNRRVESLEKSTKPCEDIEGPIGLTEWMSGEIDVEARRQLGRQGVREAVLRFREAMARIDWDEPDTDDFGNPIVSHNQSSKASDPPDGTAQ